MKSCRGRRLCFTNISCCHILTFSEMSLRKDLLFPSKVYFLEVLHPTTVSAYRKGRTGPTSTSNHFNAYDLKSCKSSRTLIHTNTNTHTQRNLVTGRLEIWHLQHFRSLNSRMKSNGKFYNDIRIPIKQTNSYVSNFKFKSIQIYIICFKVNRRLCLLNTGLFAVHILHVQTYKQYLYSPCTSI